MMRTLLLALFCGSLLAADREIAPAPKKSIDLTGYKTTKEAIKADPMDFPVGGAPRQLGYLGIALSEKPGQVFIDDVEAASPAEETGVKPGDRLVAIDGVGPTSVASAREKLGGCFAGEKLKLIVERGGNAVELAATLRPLSKPFAALDAPRAVLGIQTTRGRSGGAEITRVSAGGGAEKAGLKIGDVIIKINETALDSDSALNDILRERKPGDSVRLIVQRAKQELDLNAVLAATSTTGLAGWDDRLPTNFRKPAYKLAIIGVEYPDAKHNEKISEKDWDDALFSKDKYTGKSATGQPVFGSMADYYRELSYGKLTVEGKFLGWVEVSKKKMDYNLGSSTSANDKSKYFNEMMEKLIAKLGKDALKDYDGIFIVFAGDRVQTSRGGLYWPHRASFSYEKQRWNYFIVPEQSRGRMTDISVICHEFGHMLGLPDLYAKPENPGSEGVGVWCAMSNQLPNGRPQHFSAWSKEQMGWLRPVAIDPRLKQKLILGPVEDSPTDCLKIPCRTDGSEYFLLENRQKKGFDRELPAEGLLIWRVIPGNRGMQQVFLEEAHGVEGPSGPRIYPAAVPFPSVANHAFTPFTTPSSKSQLGGGLDVSISNIRRLPDGRIALNVGYDYR